MLSEVSFQGKVALITGAAMGIGRRIALELSSKGADLALNDVMEEELQKVLSEVKHSGVQAEAYITDVSKADHVNTMIDDVIQKFGQIDILINNAGIATPTDFLEMKEEEWDRILGVNLKGAFSVTQAVLTHMLRRNYGRIVMMGSIVGKTGGLATSVAYDVSKAGMLVMTRSLARRYGQNGITVNAVAPSFVETDMLSDLNLADKKKEVAELNVIRRLATPEDVANAVLFLCSDESSFITGETLNINGGRLMD